MAFFIQGMPIDVHDIDLQTDKNGAYEIGRILKDYAIEQIRFSSSDNIRSHIGSFSINSVMIEVMGDIQKRLNGRWDDITDISPLIRWQSFESMSLPVLDLKYEAMAYRKIGRIERANALEDFIMSLSIHKKI
jgi:hypothetical protein